MNTTHTEETGSQEFEGGSYSKWSSDYHVCHSTQGLHVQTRRKGKGFLTAIKSAAQVPSEGK
jgi:hypothetical protein